MSKSSLSKEEYRQILTHGYLIYLGFGLLLIGLPIFFLNEGFSGFNDLKFSTMKVERTFGYITDVEMTNTINDYENVYKFSYTFPVDLDTHYGYSFSDTLDVDIDDRVPILYLPSDPGISRIEGTTFNQNFWVYVGLLIMVAGIIVLIVWYFRLGKILFIVNDGTVTTASQESIEPTGMEINHQQRYEVKYAYMANGRKFYTAIHTSDPDGEAENFLLVYSNSNPSKFLLLDALPTQLAARLKA